MFNSNSIYFIKLVTIFVERLFKIKISDIDVLVPNSLVIHVGNIVVMWGIFPNIGFTHVLFAITFSISIISCC